MNLKTMLQDKAKLEEKRNALYASIEHSAKEITDQIITLDDQITALIDGPVNLRRKAEEKPYGIVNVEFQGVVIKHDQPKRVKWNEKMLANIVEQIKASNADPSEYVKVNYKVEERKYSAWPKQIKDIFEPARTTELAPVKVSFELMEQEEAAPAFPANVFQLAGRR